MCFDGGHVTRWTPLTPVYKATAGDQVNWKHIADSQLNQIKSVCWQKLLWRLGVMDGPLDTC